MAGEPHCVLQQMVDDRQTLHRHPEEGWTEFFTTYFVVQRLTKLGYTVKTGPTLYDKEAILGRDLAKVKASEQRALSLGVPQAFLDQLQGFPGAVAECDTGRAGPLTALRFDIDCVCVDETTQKDHLPNQGHFRSTHPGLMHACGHDIHTAVGLAVAQWLQTHKTELCGRIRLIFQPAEEGARGAYAMTEAGLVDDVDYFLGAHVGGLARLGEITVMSSGFLATSKLDIAFTGVPSHAGADPEKGRSALLAGAAAALAIAGIPRHSAGESRVSVGTLYAGEGRNVTPVHAKLQVETRGTTQAVNDFLEQKVRQIAQGVALAYGVQSEVTLAGKGLALPVSRPLIDRALRVAKALPDLMSAREETRSGASEDCTHFMQRVIDRGGQAVFFMYGANHPGHHRANFDVQPECMHYGLEMFEALLSELHQPKD